MTRGFRKYFGIITAVALAGFFLMNASARRGIASLTGSALQIIGAMIRLGGGQ